MMRSDGQPATSSLRRGFSLLELMIVLAVIVTIASIAAPPLMERIRNGRVQESADAVREVMGNARRYAIDAGVDYHFRYEVNGRAFVAIPAEPEPGLANNYTSDSEDIRIPLESGELDEGFFLKAAAGAGETSETLEATAFQNLSNAGELASRTWSAPITFRFDGSAEDRTIRVTDEENRTSEITVRGLTGAVTATPPYAMEDE